MIVYFLLSPWGQEQMRRQKKDIARANLSLLDVRGFEIPIPPSEDEIEEVARALVTLEEKASIHERKRDQLQDLFRSILHDLMTAKNFGQTSIAEILQQLTQYGLSLRQPG